MDNTESKFTKTSIESVKITQKSFDSVPIIIVDEASPEVKKSSHQNHNDKNSLQISQEDSENLLTELKNIRKERDEAMEDRDRLFKILERRSMEIDRLDADLRVMRSQLKSAIDSKCEAVRKFEEFQHKMTEIEFKEKRMEQERILMRNQLDMMSGDLTRNARELQQCRKESSMRILLLEGKLHEKSEELNISTLHEAQLRETNELLNNKVEELSKEVLKCNEDFSISMKKYQQELTAKSRLIDLYKDKCEDAVHIQQDITSVVTELRESLKEATEEYGKLEMTKKENELKHQNEIEEMRKQIENLQQELQGANKLLEAVKRENIEIAVEKIYPSVSVTPKLSKSGHSITEVYSMYVNAAEDLDVLNVEHEKLKQIFTQVVQEIEDKAPEIHRSQLELKKLKEIYQTLISDYRVLKSERIDAQENIDLLMTEIEKSRNKVKELQRENKDLSNQVCQLLHVIEGKPMLRRTSGDFVTFENIEELQNNNIKLVGIVRELSAAVDELEKNRSSDVSNMETGQNNSKTEAKVDEPQKDNSEMLEISKKLKQSEEMLSSIKQRHEDEMEKKQKINDNLNAQLQEIKAQLSDISATNFKLRAEIEHKDGQLKLQQKNYDMIKRKTQSIEDKSRNSTITINRLEISITHLREEINSYTSKLFKAEASVEKLLKENRNLIKSEAELRTQNECYKKQQQTQNQIMSSIETIKCILERQENQSSVKVMSDELTEVTEKYKNLEKMHAEYETKVQATIEDLDTENQRLQDDLILANDEIDKKSQKISELTRKILTKDEESQSDPESDSEMAKLKENVNQLRKIGKRYKEQYLEGKSQLEIVIAENETLKQQVQAVEAESIKLNENFEIEKSSMKNLLSKARSMITKLSEENEELKQQKTEIERKFTDNQQVKTEDGTTVNLSPSYDKNESTRDMKSPTISSQKRQLDDDENEDDIENCKNIDNSKKAKIEGELIQTAEIDKFKNDENNKLEIETEKDEKFNGNSTKNELDIVGEFQTEDQTLRSENNEIQFGDNEAAKKVENTEKESE